MGNIIFAALGGIDSSNNWQPACYDEITGNPCFISTEHSMIHLGTHYTCQDYDSDVDVATPKYWHIITPDTTARFHMKFKVIASRPGLIEFFESPTTTDNGTALTAFNNERNSVNTTSLSLFRDPTVAAGPQDGTRILVNTTGSDGTGAAGTAGGITDRNEEVILAQNEQYLVKFTAGADNCRVSCCFEFYEE